MAGMDAPIAHSEWPASACAWLGPLRGKALEPLSHRDMWVLGRAARLARLANIPFSGLQRRHVVHWLRIPMDEQCVDSDTQMMKKAYPMKIGRTWRARPTKNGVERHLLT